MGDGEKTKEELIEELQSLRQQVAQLKKEETAFETQRILLENLVAMARSEAREEMLKGALQQTLDVAAELTKAEKGSMFLLTPSGRVADAILTRAEVTAEQRKRLLGSVLDKGLAGWVIRNRKLGLIIDTEQDDRWITLPNQPYVVRSALGVPILRGDELQGIITLLHSQPEHFTEEAANLMQATADQMAIVLENTRLFSQVDKIAQALDQELEKGRQIQIDFLPPEIIQPDNWEIAACFFPAKQVAGDFYDVFTIGEYTGVVIADVCDKGVGAALFMALMRSLLRIFSHQKNLEGEASIFLETNKPANGWVGNQTSINFDHLNALQSVKLTNDYVAENHWRLSMFATMFFGVLDPKTGLMTYINGGHEPVFILGESGIKKTIKSTGPAVGMMPNMKFKIEQVQFEPGDILIGYTDGVTEAKNVDNELFSPQRLREILEQPVSSASELIGRIQMSLFLYMDEADQFDDITMLSVQYKKDNS